MWQFVTFWGKIVGWGGEVLEKRVTFLTKGEQVTVERGRLHHYEIRHVQS
jgi:single-stranded DNA-binding protein